VEVGPGKRVEGKFSPLVVKKGDTVMLAGEWSGNKVKINEKELFVVNEEEILGIVELEK
jgi:co-chaperonin GroES (HSP10)